MHVISLVSYRHGGAISCLNGTANYASDISRLVLHSLAPISLVRTNHERETMASLGSTDSRYAAVRSASQRLA